MKVWKVMVPRTRDRAGVLVPYEFDSAEAAMMFLEAESTLFASEGFAKVYVYAISVQHKHTEAQPPCFEQSSAPTAPTDSSETRRSSQSTQPAVTH